LGKSEHHHSEKERGRGRGRITSSSLGKGKKNYNGVREERGLYFSAPRKETGDEKNSSYGNEKKEGGESPGRGSTERKGKKRERKRKRIAGKRQKE